MSGRIALHDETRIITIKNATNKSYHRLQMNSIHMYIKSIVFGFTTAYGCAHKKETTIDHPININQLRARLCEYVPTGRAHRF